MLPGGPDQLPPKKILFTVIPTTVRRAKICIRAENDRSYLGLQVNEVSDHE